MPRKTKQKLVVILGPTASGKSELAVRLAKKYNGEIISADSRQVYKYLNVGTNKVPGKWQKIPLHPPFIKGEIPHFSAEGGSVLWRRKERSGGILKGFVYKNIPHHCIDFVHPRKIYTVAEYKICAQKAITKIQNRGNIPILVGGTGFYIQAVVDGLMLPNVPPNKKLRAILEKKSTEQLFDMLKKLDPERAKHIDAKNPRRLIRAVEICEATRTRIPQLQAKKEFQTLFIGIKKNYTELKKTIEKRSKKQIPGVLQEITLLKKMHIPVKRIHELGFEYRLGLEYLHTSVMPDLTRLVFASAKRVRHPVEHQRNELAIMLAKENWRYAKRQMTWFKRDKRITWISTLRNADTLVERFLHL